METETWCVLLGAAAGFLKEAKLGRFGALIQSFASMLAHALRRYCVATRKKAVNRVLKAAPIEFFNTIAP